MGKGSVNNANGRQFLAARWRCEANIIYCLVTAFLSGPFILMAAANSIQKIR